MRNKMITLCPTTYEIAKKMPNFSKAVRRWLMEMSEIEVDHAIIRAKTPVPKNYMCKNCLGNHWTAECGELK